MNLLPDIIQVGRRISQSRKDLVIWRKGDRSTAYLLCAKIVGYLRCYGNAAGVGERGGHRRWAEERNVPVHGG